jgi:hypothetical protein
MGLVVTFDTSYSVDTNEQLPAAWQVSSDKIVGRSVFLHGFGRRVDAEIAIQAMRLLGIDWDADYGELKRQWDTYGGRAAVQKHVAQHLQW